MRNFSLPDIDQRAIELFSRNHLRPEQGCWDWRGKISTVGYGRIRVKGIEYAAHRLSYTLNVGQIPDGFVVDHLCRNRACVRPDHLEAVTQSTNVNRGLIGVLRPNYSVCSQGHPIDGANRFVNNGTQRCRTCYNAYMREYMRTYRSKKTA